MLQLVVLILLASSKRVIGDCDSVTATLLEEVLSLKEQVSDLQDEECSCGSTDTTC